MTYTAMNGIYTALVTPFRDDESIDFDAVGQLVDDQVSAGIAGLVVGGSTGEFAAMSLQEREELTDHVSEVASGRAEIVVGLGSVRTADSVRLAEHALSVGAQSGLLVMPYYEPLSEAELSAFVSNVAAVGLPIMIYNNPGGTGEMLSPRFLADLSHIPNVVGVKDTTPEPNRLFAIDSLAAGRLDVLSGHDTSTIFAFLSGRKSRDLGSTERAPSGMRRAVAPSRRRPRRGRGAGSVEFVLSPERIPGIAQLRGDGQGRRRVARSRGRSPSAAYRAAARR